jgi:hypothetical protein
LKSLWTFGQLWEFTSDIEEDKLEHQLPECRTFVRFGSFENSLMGQITVDKHLGSVHQTPIGFDIGIQFFGSDKKFIDCLGGKDRFAHS